MSKRVCKIFILMASLSFNLFFSVNANEVKQYPLDAFFANVPYQNVKVSPDGKHLAFTFMDGTETKLGIIDWDKKQVVNIIGYGPYMRITEFFFANNERIVTKHGKFVGYLDTKGSNFIYVAQDVFGRDKGRQLSVPQRVSYSVVNTLPDDPKKILFKRRHYADNGAAKLFSVDIYSGKETWIDELPKDVFDFVTDKAGNPRLAFEFDVNFDNYQLKGHRIWYKPTPSSPWQSMQTSMLRAGMNWFDIKMQVLGFNNSETKAYISANVESDTDRLYSFDIQTGQISLVHAGSISDIVSSGRLYNGALEAIVFADNYNNVVYLEENTELEQIMQQVNGVFPGMEVNITSFTKGGDKLVFAISSGSQPAEFYLFDRTKPSIEYLVSSYPKIDPNDMGTMTPVTLKARDGVQLHGYVTLPKGHKKPGPGVMIVHGGPHGPRDYYGFNDEAQFLANRGYAVMQVNFRGSGGYGKAFEKSGYRKWGSTMIDDMTDAMNWMVEQGYADKDRLCVYGGSYGGYAALQSVVREPDMYKCAIGYVGVYDLGEMFNSGDTPKSEAGRRILKTYIGEDEAFHRTYSPAYNTDKIKAALFIAHGKDDVRVPMEQLESLERGLKKSGKNYIRMVRDEGHGYQQEKNKYEFYGQMEKFLAQHIGN